MKITGKVEAPLQSKQESLGIAALVLRVSYIIQSCIWFVLSQDLQAEEECSPQEPELGCAGHCGWGSYVSIEVFWRERSIWVLASTKPFRCPSTPGILEWTWNLLCPSVQHSAALKLPRQEGCHLFWMPNLAQQRLSEERCCASFSPYAAEETLRFCYSACRLVACCIYDWWPANWTPKLTKDRGWCLITSTAFWGFAVSVLLPEGEANSVKISLSNLWVIRVKRKFDT